ncbi:hypothetical protein HPG69_008868 [Diceros bicornis minor]|uniref:Olfactory receptor n=1 Tax=Diceros bicornis minor TaxID=77932 RepID=A0A7J7FBU6_DICBM|nr:hypothetical protein HPG69_008868 [Diceros bicornis minor]
MKGAYFSNLAGFILLGFSDQPQLEMVLLLVISIIYILTLMGNTTTILVSYLDPKLHISRYFFFSNLSFLDLCFTSILYITLRLDSTECVLLTVMVYDSFNAIYGPVHCGVIMNPKLL